VSLCPPEANLPLNTAAPPKTAPLLPTPNAFRPREDAQSINRLLRIIGGALTRGLNRAVAGDDGDGFGQILVLGAETGDGVAPELLSSSVPAA
jgi:hypothetical protein